MMDEIKFMSIEFNVSDQLVQWAQHFGWVQAVLVG
jgi:hypothetical protein